MKKLIIILKGGSSFHRPPRIGEFLYRKGVNGLVWKDRDLTIEEFNDVAKDIFGNERRLRIPDKYFFAVEVIDAELEIEQTEYLGENILPAIESTEEVTKQEILKEICDELYNGSIVDWNGLTDKDRANFINKALSISDDLSEVEDAKNELEDKVVVIETDEEKAAKEEAENLREPDLSDADEDEEAPEGESGLPEGVKDPFSADEEIEEIEEAGPTEEQLDDIANMQWKKFEAKYGMKKAEFKTLNNIK